MFFVPHNSWFGSGQFTVNLRCCKKLTSFFKTSCKCWLFLYYRCNAVLWGFKNRATQIGCVFELIAPNFSSHDLINIWFSAMSPIPPRYHRLVCVRLKCEDFRFSRFYKVASENWASVKVPNMNKIVSQHGYNSKQNCKVKCQNLKLPALHLGFNTWWGWVRICWLRTWATIEANVVRCHKCYLSAFVSALLDFCITRCILSTVLSSFLARKRTLAKAFQTSLCAL